MFNLESIVNSLPWIIMSWTLFTLTWGTYAAISYNHVINLVAKAYGHRLRLHDKIQVVFLWCINIIMVWFLVSWSTSTITSINDFIIVINVFYNAVLTTVSFSALHCWKGSKHIVHEDTSEEPTTHPNPLLS